MTLRPSEPKAPQTAERASKIPKLSSHDQLAGTQSIRRAVSILKEISAYGEKGIRLVDIANAMQLERPTVHRIMRGLMSQGMVSQNSQSKLYTLGPVVYELGLAAAPYHNLREICQPALHNLADRSGDSVFLVVRSGMDSVCIDRLEGNFHIKARTLDIGGRRPLGSGAGGLAILLGLPDEEVKKIIEINAERYPLFGSLTAERLQASLLQSRQAGYAINNEDVLPGVVAIGAPLQSDNGICYAGISISSVSNRLAEPRRTELANLLLKEAHQLSRKLDEAGWY